MRISDWSSDVCSSDLVGVWITLLLPWPSYALAVYVLRPTQNDFGLSAPLVMARLLAAGLLGALLLAPWLARFHPLSNAYGDLVANSFEFMLGDRKSTRLNASH